ncbi:MAG: phosphate ABC transporter permease PstA [Myxococcota bacterium]
MRRYGDALLSISTLSCLLLVLLILAVLIGDVVIHGGPRLTLGFLMDSPSAGMTEGGIFPALFGTTALVILMTLAGVPVGVATAIYLSEYAAPNSRFAWGVRLAVRNLAGVPSIVFGLFGLGFFVQFVGHGMDLALFGGEKVFGQPALLWAALTMAVLTLPVVIVATEEALRTVPDGLREGSLALGATKMQMITSVLLPNAGPGILTGTILAVSRGAGEVAPILFTGAAYFLPKLPSDLHGQFMHLGYHIFVLSTQSPDVDATAPILYATVLVLLGVVFTLNLSAVLLRQRMRARLS